MSDSNPYAGLRDRADHGAKNQFWTRSEIEQRLLRENARAAPEALAWFEEKLKPVPGAPPDSEVVWIRPGASLIGACYEAEWLTTDLNRPVAFMFQSKGGRSVPLWISPGEPPEVAYCVFKMNEEES